MEFTKEIYKSEVKKMGDKKWKGDLSEWGKGYLNALENYENLILFGVSSSKPFKIKSIFDVIPYYINMWNENKRIKKQKEINDYIKNIINVTETKN